jgi:hypothetical protein
MTVDYLTSCNYYLQLLIDIIDKNVKSAVGELTCNYGTILNAYRDIFEELSKSYTIEPIEKPGDNLYNVKVYHADEEKIIGLICIIDQWMTAIESFSREFERMKKRLVKKISGDYCFVRLTKKVSEHQKILREEVDELMVRYIGESFGYLKHSGNGVFNPIITIRGVNHILQKVSFDEEY